jgi:tripartite-type tricarboxylate transporter receptor subunit TctC
MEKILRQPIVVINKPGASTAIQMEFVRHSAPDGYTLGVFVTGGMVGTALREVPYHFFNDFTHIAQFAKFILGIQVHPESPWKTLKELVEYGQQNPGKLRYCALTAGTSSHLLAEQFAHLNNIKWVYVPVESDAAITPALLGKHVDVGFISVPGFKSFVKTGKLRLLAVFNDTRLSDFPDSPTLKETGFNSGGLEESFVFGIFGPKNLPKDITEKISYAVRTASKDQDFIKLIESQGSVPKYRDADEWISFLKKEDEEVIRIMRRIGLKVIRDPYK